MREITLTAIALEDRAYPDFPAKLAEAARWVELAARQGSDLVVLPEMLNSFGGEDPARPAPLPPCEMTPQTWQAQCAVLLEAASRLRVALAVPLLVREADHLANVFYLVSRTGQVLGRHRKRFLTSRELHDGVRPGQEPLIEWEGLKIGGAICFDSYFPAVFQRQADAGADLFLIPSLTPGGDVLNFHALHHSRPVVLAYPQWSRIIDIDGRDIAAGGYRNETLRYGFGTPIVSATINLDRAVLYADHNQQRMREVQAAYGDDVRIRFDQHNAIFLLESRSPRLSVEDVITRFGLIRRSDYLNQAQAACAATSASVPNRAAEYEDDEP